MGQSPSEFDRPVNADRLARLARERGTQPPPVDLPGPEALPGGPLDSEAANPPQGSSADKQTPAISEQPVSRRGAKTSETPKGPRALGDEPLSRGTASAAAGDAGEDPSKLGEQPVRQNAAKREAAAKAKVKRIQKRPMDDTPETLSSTSASPRHQLEAWLAGMVKAEASDLILRAGGRPSRRVAGKIHFLPGRVPGPGPLLEVLEGVMGKARMEVWRETGSADAALQLDGLGRFRLNAYKQMGEPAVVIRRINEKAPDIESLGLPMEPLQKLAMRKRGLMLVTGIAGSGKSTTLGGMIQYMNENVERHVITLEDPVELIYKEIQCVISQREIGTDCGDFGDGLRHALRQSPDVILIGEMRDAETVSAALDATETGHLVLSTLHTVNAPQTVDRILSFFPTEQHEQVRSRLADNLAGVMSQRLVPRMNEPGLVPAFELLVSTPHVRELLQEGNTAELARVIEQGTEDGLISFNQCLRTLVVDHVVDLQEALAASDRPDDLVLALRGITASHGRPKRGGGGPEAPENPRPASPHDDTGPGLRMAGGE